MQEAEPLDCNDTLPPWERPGGVRRDCKPHHGELLQLLGATSLVFGAFAFCAVLPGLVGIVLGVTVYLLGNRELSQMEKGIIDPAGKGLAREARRFAVAGIVTSLLGLLFSGCILLLGFVVRDLLAI